MPRSHSRLRCQTDRPSCLRGLNARCVGVLRRGFQVSRSGLMKRHTMSLAGTGTVALHEKADKFLRRCSRTTHTLDGFDRYALTVVIDAGVNATV